MHTSSCHKISYWFCKIHWFLLKKYIIFPQNTTLRKMGICKNQSYRKKDLHLKKTLLIFWRKRITASICKKCTKSYWKSLLLGYLVCCLINTLIGVYYHEYKVFRGFYSTAMKFDLMGFRPPHVTPHMGRSTSIPQYSGGPLGEEATHAGNE